MHAVVGSGRPGRPTETQRTTAACYTQLILPTIAHDGKTDRIPLLPNLSEPLQPQWDLGEVFAAVLNG